MTFQGYGKAMQTEDVRFIAGTSLTGTYQDLGSPLENISKALILKNLTDVTVELSIDDGETTGFRLPPSTADVVSEESLFIAKGSQIQVRHTGVPSLTGEVIVETIYVTRR